MKDRLEGKKIIRKIIAHFEHTCRKHPEFCKGLFPFQMEKLDDRTLSEKREALVASSAAALARARQQVKDGEEKGMLLWTDILQCEIQEAMDAVVNGRAEDAIEELYDSIAVCLRAICVIESHKEGTGNEE